MDVVTNDGGQSRGAVGWVWHCCIQSGPREVYAFEHSRTRVVSISTSIAYPISVVLESIRSPKIHQRDATLRPRYGNDRNVIPGHCQPHRLVSSSNAGSTRGSEGGARTTSPINRVTIDLAGKLTTASQPTSFRNLESALKQNLVKIYQKAAPRVSPSFQ